MNIDSQKYIALMSNVEAELIVLLQNYVEFLGLGYLNAVRGLRDVKSLTAQCLYKVKKEGITLPATFPTEMVVEAGARKSLWFFQECDFTPLEHRLKAREEEERALYTLLQAYKVYKQIQDLR